MRRRRAAKWALGTFFALLILWGVNLTSAKVVDRMNDQKFEALAKKFIAELLERQPEMATSLGEHRYDTRLGDYSLAGVEADRKFNENYLRELNAIPLAELNSVNGVDYRIMRNQLEYNLFRIDTLKEHEWNPQRYNIGGAIYGLIGRDFAPLPERLQSVRERLKGIPEVLAQAKKNLRNPPRVNTETAILQNKGNISLVSDEINALLAAQPAAMRDEFAPVQARLCTCTNRFDSNE